MASIGAVVAGRIVTKIWYDDGFVEVTALNSTRVDLKALPDLLGRVDMRELTTPACPSPNPLSSAVGQGPHIELNQASSTAPSQVVLIFCHFNSKKILDWKRDGYNRFKLLTNK